MKKNTFKLWAVVNKDTNRVSWTRTAKRPAIFETRVAAKEALASGDTCGNGRVVVLTSQAF